MPIDTTSRFRCLRTKTAMSSRVTVCIIDLELMRTTSLVPQLFVIDKNGVIQFMYVGSHQFDLANHQSLIDCLKSFS